MPVVVVQSFLLSILDGLEMPYQVTAANAYITPPDPRIQATVPAIYIWPSDGSENRSAELGGTIPRNTGLEKAAMPEVNRDSTVAATFIATTRARMPPATSRCSISRQVRSTTRRSRHSAPPTMPRRTLASLTRPQ